MLCQRRAAQPCAGGAAARMPSSRTAEAHAPAAQPRRQRPPRLQPAHVVAPVGHGGVDLGSSREAEKSRLAPPAAGAHRCRPLCLLNFQYGAPPAQQAAGSGHCTSRSWVGGSVMRSDAQPVVLTTTPVSMLTLSTPALSTPKSRAAATCTMAAACGVQGGVRGTGRGHCKGASRS